MGTELLYRHEGVHRKAQVTSHHPDTGEVNGIAVYRPIHAPGTPEKDQEWAIDFGVNDPKHAETPQHETTDGYFKRR